jgi:hypothetical protein
VTGVQTCALPIYEGGSVRAGDYNFFYGKGNENHQLGTEFLVQHRTVSAVHTVKGVIYSSERLLA